MSTAPPLLSSCRRVFSTTLRGAATGYTSPVVSCLATSGAALRMSARYEVGNSSPKAHPVQYVATKPPELSRPSQRSGTEELHRSHEYPRGGRPGGTMPNTSVEEYPEFGSAEGAAEEGTDRKDVSERHQTPEPTTVDFTSGAAVKKLDKLYRQHHCSDAYLTSRDRQMFTRMIHDTFYKEEGSSTASTSPNPAMLYQASLEVKWVEEWVAERARAGQWSTDDARKLVKRSLLERVDLHKPLSYIIGSQPFFGCDIHCEPPLLCPRPETEMWTHWMVYTHLEKSQQGQRTGDSPSPLRILDVCCGTGCIGVALAKHLPGAAVTGLDILPDAVRVSKENARRNGIPEERYTAIESDMFAYFEEQNEASTSPPQGLPTSSGERPLGVIRADRVGTFDVIVSNPPYILPQQYIDLPRTISHWESKTALVGDGYRESRQYLYFKELCIHGARLLKPRQQRHLALRDAPNIAIEVGLQAHLVAELMEKSPLWRDVEIHLDYAQQERWITGNSAH